MAASRIRPNPQAPHTREPVALSVAPDLPDLPDLTETTGRVPQWLQNGTLGAAGSRSGAATSRRAGRPLLAVPSSIVY